MRQVGIRDNNGVKVKSSKEASGSDKAKVDLTVFGGTIVGSIVRRWLQLDVHGNGPRSAIQYLG